MGRLQRKKDQATKARKKKNRKGLSSVNSRDDTNISKAIAVSSVTKGKKQRVGSSKSVPVKQGNNFFSSAFSFFRESKSELKRVVWPSKKQTLGSTFVVIIVVCLVSLFLGIVDTGLSSVIRLILR